MSVDFYGRAKRLEQENPGSGYVYWAGALSAALRAFAPDDAMLAQFDRWCDDQDSEDEKPRDDDPFWQDAS